VIGGAGTAFEVEVTSPDTSGGSAGGGDLATLGGLSATDGGLLSTDDSVEPLGVAIVSDEDGSHSVTMCGASQHTWAWTVHGGFAHGAARLVLVRWLVPFSLSRWCLFGPLVKLRGYLVLPYTKAPVVGWLLLGLRSLPLTLSLSPLGVTASSLVLCT
jgi:hypothetical protein